MKYQFELAGGSITGREHSRLGKNNQDAFAWYRSEDYLIAIVSDGCGSGAHSEVGAKLGVRLTITAIQQSLQEDDQSLNHEAGWKRLQNRLLAQLQRFAEQLGGELEQTVQNYLLFTIVGGVITPEQTTLFALGDGVFVINGQVCHLGPFPGNAPPYLAYGLLDQGGDAFQLKPVQQFSTSNLESLLIGSDGVDDLIQVAHQTLPGRSEPVGSITQFWQDDRYFHNSDQVRRRLSMINREAIRLDNQTQQLLKHPGLLPDDTTLITIRKQEALC